MSHPSLGLPPLDRTAGYPAAAARIRGDLFRLAGTCVASRDGRRSDDRRALRRGGAGILLHDAELLAERFALCLETGDPGLAHEYAEWTPP